VIPTELAASRRGSLGPDTFGATWLADVASGRVLRRGTAARRLVIDSREVGPGDCFVALGGENFDGHDFLPQVLASGAAGVVVGRPMSREALAAGAFIVRVEDTHGALRDIAHGHRARHRAKVIGITGSCGKTSTKDMLGEVLGRVMPTIRSPKSFNNHVGVPLTIFQIQSDTRAAVVEIGTNAPGEIEQLAAVARPDIGIVTRVDESHLMHLHTLRGVALEKSNLVAALRKDGLAILNGDDPSSSWMRDVTDARVLEVRVGREADCFATDVQFHGLGTSFRFQGETPVTLPRLGTHNVYNALFTIAAARELGVSDDQILAGLCDVPPSSRRLECKRLGDIAIIDDTYNSNLASARVALLALNGLNIGGRRLVVLGEMLELGDQSEAMHRQLGDEVARSAVDLLVTVGAGALPLAEAALSGGMNPGDVHAVADPQAALEMLRSELRSGDWLLCKASRGVGLDRLVDGLLADTAADTAADSAADSAAGSPAERSSAPAR
jgi:UDP-N-acetylmuramoyl-tripeptide--D-alanyl-D-alanine ligase